MEHSFNTGTNEISNLDRFSKKHYGKDLWFLNIQDERNHDCGYRPIIALWNIVDNENIKIIKFLSIKHWNEFVGFLKCVERLDSKEYWYSYKGHNIILKFYNNNQSISFNGDIIYVNNLMHFIKFLISESTIDL